MSNGQFCGANGKLSVRPDFFFWSTSAHHRAALAGDDTSAWPGDVSYDCPQTGALAQLLHFQNGGIQLP
jgi:hypothetical protein